MDRNIPVRIKGFSSPESPGTLVTGTADEAGTVKSIASRSGLAIITLYGPAMAYTPGLASDLFGALSSAGINVYTIGTSMASLSVIVDGSDADNTVDLFRKLHESVVHDISVQSDVSLLCAAGAGLRKHSDVIGKIFRAVSKSGTKILLTADGGSSVAVIIAISDEDCPKAINAVHREFI
jgi:aspartokinase